MTTFGRPHRHLECCGSTNDIARAWALDPADPAPSGALVTADFQTRGRGQRGHEWQAEAGQSALTSFVYRLPPSVDTALLGLFTVLAVAESLESLDFAPAIKWPNDLLVNGGKVGGILVEVAAETAILGIGINVSQERFSGASEFVYPPTSLRLVSGREQSAQEMIEAVSRALTRWEPEMRRDRAAVLGGCRARLARGVAVRQGKDSGELIGLTDSGAAVVRLAEGTFAEWTTVN